MTLLISAMLRCEFGGRFDLFPEVPAIVIAAPPLSLSLLLAMSRSREQPPSIHWYSMEICIPELLQPSIKLFSITPFDALMSSPRARERPKTQSLIRNPLP